MLSNYYCAWSVSNIWEFWGSLSCDNQRFLWTLIVSDIFPELQVHEYRYNALFYFVYLVSLLQMNSNVPASILINAINYCLWILTPTLLLVLRTAPLAYIHTLSLGSVLVSVSVSVSASYIIIVVRTKFMYNTLRLSNFWSIATGF